MKLEAISEIYTPEVRSALETYSHHLQDTTNRLRERERNAEEEIEQYDNSGDDMKEIVKRYGILLKEMESVQTDIKRLGGELQD